MYGFGPFLDTSISAGLGTERDERDGRYRGGGGEMVGLVVRTHTHTHTHTHTPTCYIDAETHSPSDEEKYEGFHYY